MATHVAYVSPMSVSGGSVINKNTATIKEMMVAGTEMRVVEDPNIPNTINNPSIQNYLDAESAAGFTLTAMTNTVIVTDN